MRRTEDPRVVQLKVRLTQDEASALDGARGSSTRSDYVRDAIGEKVRGGEPVEP